MKTNRGCEWEGDGADSDGGSDVGCSKKLTHLYGLGSCIRVTIENVLYGGCETYEWTNE